MVKIEENVEDAGGSSRDNNILSLSLVPKTEPFDSNPNYGPSSSSSQSRLQFIEMGFPPSLVDKVLKENCDNDPAVILDTLFAHSALENQGAESSNSLEGFFGYDNEEETKPYRTNTEMRSCLLSMNFSEQEINSALHLLGTESSLEQVIEYIINSQTRNFSDDFETKPSINTNNSLNEENNDENLYGVAEKTLALLQMGFTEKEVSFAIDNFGAKVSVMELSNSILETRSRGRGHTHHVEDIKPHVYTDTSYLNNENGETSFNPNGFYYDNNDQTLPNKRPKPTFTHETRSSNPHSRYWPDGSIKDEINHDATPGASKTTTSLPGTPYFIYGNVLPISRETWDRLSQFLYETEPEFVNSQYFSALIRKEGYIHNLPTEKRHYIVPKSPNTIEAALPFTSIYQPNWDPRRKLNDMGGTDVTGTDINHICDKLGKMMRDSQGALSKEKQNDILEKCNDFNLIWVSENKLAPLEPHQLERIMGYPVNYTRLFGLDTFDRLKAMKQCFQTDTIGHILSPFKDLYPNGVRILSIFTGIGGAEIALDRLGVRIKCVVSVEFSETNRKIFQRWWSDSEQSGELRQIGGINKLNSSKIEEFVREFGGFDLIIGVNPGVLVGNGGSSSYSNLRGMDSSSFFEFVRVLQRVRSVMK